MPRTPVAKKSGGAWVAAIRSFVERQLKWRTLDEGSGTANPEYMAIYDKTVAQPEAANVSEKKGKAKVGAGGILYWLVSGGEMPDAIKSIVKLW